MNPSRLLSFFLICLTCISSAEPMPPTAAAAKASPKNTQTLAAPRLIHDYDPMQVRIYRLANGLTVYLTRNPSSPSFYAEITTRVGSYNDPDDCTGLAHYLEHLMFKGTKKIGTLDFKSEQPYLDNITQLYEQHFHEQDPDKRKKIYQKINQQAQLAAKFAVANDIDRIYKFMGGSDINAHTSYHETTYKVQLPSNQLERWAIIESERFSDPIFRLFHTELEAVYEEKNQALDSSDSRLNEELVRRLYPNHPYGSRTVLGNTEHLKRPSIKRIYQYYRKYYVPGNMAIFISGDIDIDSTIKLINQHFGKWTPKPVPHSTPKTPSLVTQKQQFSIPDEGDESITLAWRTVPISHPDGPALDVLDMILNNSYAGLIDLNLVQSQKLFSAGSFPENLNQAGAEYLWAYPREGQSLDELEALLISQIERIKQGKFDDWLLPAIVSDFKSSTQLLYESNISRVELMRDSFISRRDWNSWVQYNTKIAAVTKQDVIRVANKYFNGNYISARIVKGKPNIAHIEKPAITPVPLNPSASSKFSQTIKNIKCTEIKPHFIRAGTDYKKTATEDITYFTTYNPFNELFSITWSFPTGSINSPKLALATDLLELSGTNKLTPEELNKRWYQLGITPEISLYENRLEISLSGLSENYQQGTQLLWQWIHDFNAKQSQLTNLVDDLKLARKDAREDANTLIHALARYSRFGKNSIYLTRLTSTESGKLTIPELKKALQNATSLPHQINYFGKLNETQWRKLTPTLPVTATTPAPPARKLRQTKAPLEILFIHKEMAQTKIWIESNSPELSTSDYTKFHLYNNYFGMGMSSVVFQELRESTGLAYEATSYLAYSRWQGDPNLCIADIGCQADKAPQAISKFLDLFEHFPANSTRFNETQQSIHSSAPANPIGPRDAVATIQFWNRQRLGFNPNRKVYFDAPKVTLPELVAFQNKTIAKHPRRICIVGDKKRIDLKALNKIAPVTILDKDTILNR